MLSYRDIQRAVQQIGINTNNPVILHTDNAVLAEVRGGAETLAGALSGIFPQVLVPAFTSSTQVIPAVGPNNNALDYANHETSLDAQPFTPTMPADTSLGDFNEKFRLQKNASRSMHPLLSFSGIGLQDVLAAQTYRSPLAPISALLEQNASILMLGTSHRQNISIHLGEELAGRKTFIRWALTASSIAECPSMPGCPNGFEAIEAEISRIETRTGFGGSPAKMYTLIEIVELVRQKIISNPLALLCETPGCPRCDAVRKDVHGRGLN